MNETVVCADPDPDARGQVADALRESGFTVREFATLCEASEAAADCAGLVTEYEFPDGTGLELVREARDAVPDVAAVLYTDADLSEIDTGGAADGVLEFVPKDDDSLETLVDVVSTGVGDRTQTSYPLPDDETARIETLERYVPVLDEAAESVDRLGEFACAALDVPMAGVGIIDADEERFLTCVGASFGRVPRADTICTYAMLDEEVTVVEDVAADPRFSGNEYLSEIRFYASANLTAPDGSVVGTFCVYDVEPRSFGEAERERLQAFADEAMEQLELRRRLRAETDGGNRDGGGRR